MKKIKKTLSGDPILNHASVGDLLKRNDFRITIFGSARIKKNDKTYKQVYSLAKKIGKEGFDLVTGGGPGLMEAANSGHEAGDKVKRAQSIGLTIRLPWESEKNEYLEVHKHFAKFSDRLDHFMALSSVVIITPGGIGTVLELMYTWQLEQVQHICPLPIILVGRMWEPLIKWFKKYPLKHGLISPKDMNNIYVARSNKKAIEIINKTYKVFEKEGKNYCLNVRKYKLD